jgi:predicted RNA-binding protein with PUA-like domain
MRYWLMKSEPEAYSIDDLKRDKKIAWEGVRNYQARNFMREMKEGDTVIFYHSSCNPPGAVGEGSVCSTPYPDKSQFDKKSDYFNPKSTQEKPIWQLVDICYVSTLKRMVTLEEMRNDPTLTDMILLQPGSRLSVLPVEKKHYEKIVELSGLKI